MAQYLRPTSTITNTNWSSGSLAHTYLDEVTPNDTGTTDIVLHMSTKSGYLECKFGTPSVTPTSGVVILRVRAMAANANELRYITPSIKVGSTVLKTGEAVAITTSYVTYELALTEVEAASITDWSNLRFGLTINSGSGMTYSYLNWAELQVPDGPTPSVGLEMGCSF